jgi:hypothetical protein
MAVIHHWDLLSRRVAVAAGVPLLAEPVDLAEVVAAGAPNKTVVVPGSVAKVTRVERAMLGLRTKPLSERVVVAVGQLRRVALPQTTLPVPVEPVLISVSLAQRAPLTQSAAMAQCQPPVLAPTARPAQGMVVVARGTVLRVVPVARAL